MSAYVVDKTTIDAIVTIKIALDRLDDGSNEPPDCSEGLAKYDRLGQMLWRENHRSVNARYSETYRAPSYKFRAVPYDRNDLGYALKRIEGALRSLRYQSCEHDGWEKSRAAAFVSGMIQRVSTRCPKCCGPGHMCMTDEDKGAWWDQHRACMHGDRCDHDWFMRLDARGEGWDIGDHARDTALFREADAREVRT